MKQKFSKKHVAFLSAFLLAGLAPVFGQFSVNTSNNTTGTTSANPITVHGSVVIGHGNSGDATSTALGQGALPVTSGINSNNSAVGYNSMAYTTTGVLNTAFGASALANNIVGFQNTAVGASAIASHRGNWNTAVGCNALATNSNVFTGSSANCALGYNALFNLPDSSSNNIAIGIWALSGVNGRNNIAIGNSCFQNRSGSDNVLIGHGTTLSNSSSFQLNLQGGIYGKNMRADLDAHVGIGVMPGEFPGFTSALAKLEVGGTLKVDDVQDGTNSSGKFLFWGSDGIIRKASVSGTGGVANSCTGSTNINYLTKNADASGNISCSQVWDNGSTSGVGIGTNTGFTYTGTTLTGLIGPSPAMNSTFKLVVNGASSGTTFCTFSDKRLKKDIKRIEKSIDKIRELNGYTYNWNRQFNKDLNLDDNRQAGFLAQEVEKIFPEAVVINSKGLYGMNYNAIMPLLAEGIKEQQSQIESQKVEIENLKLQVSELKSKLQQLLPGDQKLRVGNTMEVVPNPITGTSTVSYKLDNNNPAFLVISDLQGKIVKQIVLARSHASGQVQVSKNELLTGMYIFSIISGNTEVQSKKVLVSQ